ncbi:heavy metal translocating P-type ATPase [Vibrio salinus]|uniref:heavy metal translocating P-type ATPase n=1 Tax=Vibrio salinus TaxID=2899784 RepID=UPI001E52B33B|nr:heavy metal translocating P-type ATPase [Vibrio salinus]MCE0494417.1 copper-translocating P-type ATPase [Vibrio salinus]
MNHMSLPLSGLNCMGCAKKLENSLKKAFNVEISQLSPTFISMDIEASFEDVAQQIESIGYSVAKQSYQLSGLHCGGCVNKLTKHLGSSEDIRHLIVEKEQMTLETALSPAQIKTLVSEVGFEAKDITISGSSETKTEQEEPITDNKKTIGSEATQKKDRHSEKTTSSPVTTHLLIKGMTCASCVSSVEKALTAVPYVDRAQVNLAEQSAIVFSSRDIEIQSLLQSVDNTGYQAELVDKPETQQARLQNQQQHIIKQHKRHALFGLLIGLPIMLWGVLGGSMMITTLNDQIGWGIVALLCLLLLMTSGKAFYTNAWKSLKHKRATMDTLVALGTGAAWLYSTFVVLFPDWFPAQARHVYFEASAMIIGLISLGHAIESTAKAKTTLSLQALIKLQPKNATVLIEEQEKNVPIEQIKPGMVIHIKSGEQIPVDGEIIEGRSYIDESMLTGEPIPAEKKSGDKVSAGTINQDGSLIVKTTGIGSETMLARIIHMVRTAQSSKPEIAKLADRISAVFVPVVVSIAIFSALIWFIAGPDPKINYMLVVATTVLIIACPCALGLATPLSVTVGIGKAAEMGILIKDAEALQTASTIDTVVFDKTGTLTEGKPDVQNFKALTENTQELLSIAYALEKNSDHPLAKAICRYAQERNITPLIIDDFHNLRGRGLSASYHNQNVLIASVAYLKSQEIDISGVSDELVRYEQLAQTPIGLSIDNKLLGIFALSDTLRTAAKETISRLNQMGIETVMLTGDQSSVAQAIGKSLGIQTVISQVLPDEKAQHISALQKQGKTVAMVGDGINDAPALAKADIGIAMGEGSDVAIESAQMTLLTPSPEQVIKAIKLSKATFRNIKQNLFGAFIYNALGIPVAAGILFPLTGFLLNPVIAGAAMALSSITVVSNANRLRFFDPDS